MGYGYDKDGKTFAYKMGTNYAGLLLKGARKVPEGHLVLHRPQRTALHGTARIWRATASSVRT